MEVWPGKISGRETLKSNKRINNEKKGSKNKSYRGEKPMLAILMVVLFFAGIICLLCRFPRA